MFDRFQTDFDLLDQSFDHLFPLFRSITGPGIEASIDYFRQFMPLEVKKIPTGSEVFDWTVPPEWHCKRARLWAPDGTLLCDTEVNNLSVVNYAEPVDGTFSLEELEPHLHSLPDLPDAIPYVTSYYKRTWGFCMSHETRQSLQPGQYRVLIESDFKDGGVPYATCVLPGDSDREIMLTSYLCHPSLANNELSGPLTLLALYRRIKAWPKRRYSYRFVLNPETIGSLCFLYDYHNHLREKLEAGLIVTCIGGGAPGLRYKASRRGNSLFDSLAMRFTNGKEEGPLPFSYMDFTPTGGSDERQYCAPGFNLPMGQVARAAYGFYDGYHNSHDTKDFMGIDNLVESVDALEHFLSLGEIAGNPVNHSPFGEPQLGKRNLYPNMNSEKTRSDSNDALSDGRTSLERLLWVLNMADGQTSLAEIADKCGCSIGELKGIIERLEEEKLISYHQKDPV
ncbi:DUF4910 domain-containing protein [Kordiimonas lipolytica]|uniref:DUF4910 domain-containing protein n=1 Tax=Kordiimonas lipolytica TaxID=1662421 RepID=A0ABV8UD45_9PROT|nr:DUF4910 domain-containing protein [Kordiimonas lipolytica]